MHTRRLGRNGPELPALGYGAMDLEGYFGPAGEDQALEVLAAALSLGQMIDTADAYGNGRNETLVGQALKRHRGKAFVASKFGIVFDPALEARDLPTNWGATLHLRVNARPEYARRALDETLRRLDVEALDLWYLHHPDPGTPLTETFGAMADQVVAGKVRHLGLSNATPEQVRAAHRVHPLAAVQYEYSLWRREAEAGLLPVLRELGICLVCWAPLGSGFLAGAQGLPGEDDFRRHDPRFSEANLAANRERFAPLAALARDLGASPAQLALAWLLHQGPDILPIPGTRSPAHLAENAKAADLALNEDLVRRIGDLARPGLARGATLI